LRFFHRVIDPVGMLRVEPNAAIEQAVKDRSGADFGYPKPDETLLAAQRYVVAVRRRFVRQPGADVVTSLSDQTWQCQCRIGSQGLTIPFHGFHRILPAKSKWPSCKSLMITELV